MRSSILGIGYVSALETLQSPVVNTHTQTIIFLMYQYNGHCCSISFKSFLCIDNTVSGWWALLCPFRYGAPLTVSLLALHLRHQRTLWRAIPSNKRYLTLVLTLVSKVRKWTWMWLNSDDCDVSTVDWMISSKNARNSCGMNLKMTCVADGFNLVFSMLCSNNATWVHILMPATGHVQLFWVHCFTGKPSPVKVYNVDPLVLFVPKNVLWTQFTMYIARVLQLGSCIFQSWLHLFTKRRLQLETMFP